MLKTNYLNGFYLLPNGKIGKIKSSQKFDDGSEYIYVEELDKAFEIREIKTSERIIDLLQKGDVVDGKTVFGFSQSFNNIRSIAFLENTSKKNKTFEVYSEKDLEEAYILTQKGLKQIEYVGI